MAAGASARHERRHGRELVRSGERRGRRIVGRSSAYGDSNPEVAAARAGGIPVWKREGRLARARPRQARRGGGSTHGKEHNHRARLDGIALRWLEPVTHMRGGPPRHRNERARRQGALLVIEATSTTVPSCRSSQRSDRDERRARPHRRVSNARRREGGIRALHVRDRAGRMARACADDPARRACQGRRPTSRRAAGRDVRMAPDAGYRWSSSCRSGWSVRSISPDPLLAHHGLSAPRRRAQRAERRRGARRR